jgi:hypothetical protein
MKIIQGNTGSARKLEPKIPKKYQKEARPQAVQGANLAEEPQTPSKSYR